MPVPLLSELMVPTIGNAIAVNGVFASLFWAAKAASLVRHRGEAAVLEEQPADPPEGGWPKLAVVVAARNEEAEIERAVGSLLGQDYPDLEVIAVDDRSTDATGAILDRLAAASPRLRVVHVEELPPGWLGKNHALQAAADSTGAPWLLFTDGDVIHAPGALRKAVAAAERGGDDHVTVTPDVPTELVGERLFLAMFNLAFLVHSPARAVHDRERRAYIGIGAFNLVRAEAFRAIGGLRSLRLSVDDDMRLGQALKWAGYRSRILLGRNAVSVRWHVGLWRMIAGLEKNFYAGLGCSPGRVAVVLPGLFWLGAAPHAGLFFGPWWTRAVCAGGIGAIGFILHRVARPARVSGLYAAALPLGAAAVALALVRSTWVTLRNGGVRWRDSSYPLRELKEHIRRRDAWLGELWRSTR